MGKIRCPDPECNALTRHGDDDRRRSIPCTGCGQLLKVSEGAESQPNLSTGRDVASVDRAWESPSSSAESPPQTASAAFQSLTIARFEIRAKLGAGGFGTVYRAFDPKLGRDVAIKVLQQSLLEDADMRERFFREARTAAMLRHPHIVPVYDAGRDGDRHYIATAFIEGQTLARRIDSKPLHPATAAKIVRRLAEALHYAHSEGIIHRDIKPSNAIIDKKGEPHLLDFGIARLEHSSERLTRDGSLLGTPAYMSPEQAGGKRDALTAASDQYSLGATLYELLTGQAPFSGPPAVVIFNILNQAPPPPRQLNPKTPRDLETICLKAMSFEPDKRYADCQLFAEDLRRFLSDEPILARTRSRRERFVRWCKREPVVFGLSIAMILVTIVGFSLTLSALSVARRSRDAADKHARDADRARDDAVLSTHVAQQREDELKIQNARLEETLAELGVAKSKLTEVKQNNENIIVTEEEKRRLVERASQADRQRLVEAVTEVTEMKERFPVQVYGREIESAQLALRKNAHDEAKRILEKLDPTIRGPEWFLLHAAADNSLLITDTTLWSSQVSSTLSQLGRVVDDSFFQIGDTAVRMSDGAETVLDLPKSRFVSDFSRDTKYVATQSRSGTGAVLVAEIPPLFSHSKVSVPIGTRMAPGVLSGYQHMVTSTGAMIKLTYDFELQRVKGMETSVIYDKSRLFPRLDDAQLNRSRREGMLKAGLKRGDGDEIIAYLVSATGIHLSRINEDGFHFGSTFDEFVQSNINVNGIDRRVVTVSYQNASLSDLWPLRDAIGDLTLGLRSFRSGEARESRSFLGNDRDGFAILDKDTGRQLRIDIGQCEAWTTSPPVRHVATISLERGMLGLADEGGGDDKSTQQGYLTLIWIGLDSKNGTLRFVRKATRQAGKMMDEVRLLSRTIDFSKSRLAQ